MRRLVGNPSPAAHAADPFIGLLPWELTTSTVLRVPWRQKEASDALDVDFGYQLFSFAGVCVVENAVNKELTTQLREAGLAFTEDVCAAVASRCVDVHGTRGFRFHEACQRGPGRLNMRLMIDGKLSARPSAAIFQEARLHEQAPWMALVRRILGEDCKLLSQGLVVADPGTTEQALHSDGPHIPIERWRSTRGGALR